MTPGGGRAVAGLVASLATGLALAGCGAGAGMAAAGRGTVALHARELVLIAGGGDRDLVRGARGEASRLGLRLVVRGRPRLGAGAQISLVDAATVAKPRAVILAPVDRDALAAPIASMAHAGIRVVVLGGTPAANGAPGAGTARAGAAAVRRAVARR